MIVPSIDVRAGRVSFRPAGGAEVAPADLAMRFVTAGAEELHLVDLDGAERGQHANAALLAAIARTCAVPCRLAGGVSSLRRAREALAAGFAGVLFSSAVFGDDELLPEIAALGARAIVEIEADRGTLAPRGGHAELVPRAAGRDAVDSASAAVAAGVRALYVVDVSADGRLGGPPLVLLSQIRKTVGDGVAFHTGGGIRDLADVAAVARWGAASAVVGRALAEGRFTLEEAKRASRSAL